MFKVLIYVFIILLFSACTPRTQTNNINNQLEISIEEIIEDFSENSIELHNIEVTSEENIIEISTRFSVGNWILDKNDRMFIGYIDDDFFGLYLPTRFIESLRDTRNFQTSMMLNHRTRINWRNTNETHHDIFIVTGNRIFSNLGFHDGYAIPGENIVHFEFINDNGQKHIIDNNGHRYKRISNNPEMAFGRILTNFISNVIFAPLIDNGKIYISERFRHELRGERFYETIVTVSNFNIDFSIDLGWVFDNSNLYLRNEEFGLVALTIENGKYIFYKTELDMSEGWPGIINVTDEIALVIEL